MNRRGYGDLALEAPTARVTLFGFDEEGKMCRHGVVVGIYLGGGGGVTDVSINQGPPIQCLDFR